jgi:hypothetical protein
MKLSHMCVLLSLFVIGCATAYQRDLQQIMESKTEWEQANEILMVQYNTKKMDASRAFGGLFDNCFKYSTYEYQRTLCSTASGALDLSLKGQFPVQDFKQIFIDSGELAKLGLFPQIPTRMKAYGYCMANGEPVHKIVCAQLSRILESFANGNLSRAEFDRQNAQYSAILDVYNSSQPTFADYLAGALRIYAESIPKTSTCYGQVSGNQVYAQCQ